MKYFLAVLIMILTIILSYIIFSPYLLMSFRFKAHWTATQEAINCLAEWVEN